MDETRKPFYELGRRLKAAFLSCRLGTGVDYMLKQIPEDPGEDWVELAKEIDRGYAESVGAQLAPRHRLQFKK